MPENYKDHLFALILAGGGGTRLWPKSREKTPKQFLPLFEHKTLTQITAHRLNKIIPWEKIYCVTVSEAYKKEIMKEVPQFVGKNIIVEPARRDTGPAHALGALYIQKRDPKAVIITESADRLVRPVEDYLKTMEVAAELAFGKGVLVCIGIKPRYANVGYGHIKKGERIETIRGVRCFEADKFVEKPPLEVAERYTKSGDYFWNAGQFVWRADSILMSLKDHAPEIYSKLQKFEPFIDGKEEEKKLLEIYESMPKVAIDVAVAEKEKNMLLVVADFYWTDIGDWKEVWENLPQDKDGNVFIDGDEPGGEIINIDTTDALVHKDGRLIAIVDVDNLCVIDTKEILLVCPKSQAQSVKKVVEELKAKKRKEYL